MLCVAALFVLFFPASALTVQKHAHKSHKTLEACVESYASQMEDAVDKQLGKKIRARAYNFTGIKMQKVIFGAGHGTTGTRSLHSVLKTIGLNGDHWMRDEGSNAKGVQLFGMLNHTAKQCFENIRNLFPNGWDYNKDYMIDSPAPELFLDLFLTFPNSRFILTDRPANEWAASRKANHPFTLAPLQEPCGQRISLFTEKQVAKMFELNNQLVRCVTADSDRLYEINWWTDSKEKLSTLTEDLQQWVASAQKTLRRSIATAMRRVRLIKLTSEEEDQDCLEHDKIFSSIAPTKTKSLTKAEVPAEYTVAARDLGLLVQAAVKHTCEVRLMD